MLHLSAPHIQTSSVASSLVILILYLSCGKGADYCNVTCEGQKHTVCLYPTTDPGPECSGYDLAQSALTQEQKVTILDFHNKMRSLVAMGKEKRGTNGPQPQAADMIQLIWDKELELIANHYAKQCIYEHDVCRNKVDGTVAGQNIAIKTGMFEKYLSHFKLMYNEVKDFDKDMVPQFQSSHGGGPLVGHYTQMVWATTTTVGCDISRFNYKGFNSRMSELIVCNYSPAGNYLGEKMYTQGEPCSQCPEGLKCSTIYEGLCENPVNATFVKRSFGSKVSGRSGSKHVSTKSSSSYNVPALSTTLSVLVCHISLFVF